MTNPLVSIITPIFNAEKHLSKMLDSMLSQTYSNWELILIDDGSTDSTSEIIKSYQRKDNRIQSYAQSNSGPAKARNNGIDNATGKYICFIDADDWVTPNYIEKLIEPILKFQIDLVCAGYQELNPQFPNGLKLHDFKPESHNKIISKIEYQSNLFNGVSGVLWGKLFKSEIFKSHTIKLHPELRLSEDLLAVLEYSLYIENAYIISESLYFYNRLDENSLSGKAKISNYNDLLLLTKEIYKYQENLKFLDLNSILNQRKFTFFSKLLKDNSKNKKEFYTVAEFVTSNAQFIPSETYGQSPMNNKILNWIFAGKYLKAWLFIKMYTVLRNIKHG